MQRDDDDLTSIERRALAEVLAGLREVAAASGYGNVTLFMQDCGEKLRVEVTKSKKVM